MLHDISYRSLPLLSNIDSASFNPSCITVVDGASGMVPEVLFHLCATSVVSFDRDAVFVDGWNSFNPYVLLRITKSFGAEPRKVLS